MTLVSALKSQVDSGVRHRGEEYFRAGKIRKLQADEWELEAIVRGSRNYQVGLYRFEQTIGVDCDCPYFLDNQAPCKHIWAALLAADAKNALKGDGSNNNLVLDVVDSSDENEDEGYFFDDDESPVIRKLPSTYKSPARKSTRKKTDSWKKGLAALQEFVNRPGPGLSTVSWADRQIMYIVEAWRPHRPDQVLLSVAYRQRKANGDWSKPRNESIHRKLVSQLGDALDREVLSILMGAEGDTGYGYYGYGGLSRFSLGAGLADLVGPRLGASGRLFLRRQDQGDLTPLTWDDGPPWNFVLRLERDEKGKNYQFRGCLEREGERRALSEPVLAAANLVFWPDRVARFDPGANEAWLGFFKGNPALTIPAKQIGEWQKQFYRLKSPPRVEWPEEVRVEEVQGTPIPRLKLSPGKASHGNTNRIEGQLSFDYQDQNIGIHEMGEVFVPEERRLIQRDHGAEGLATERLRQMGFKLVQYFGRGPFWELPIRALPKVVPVLVQENWHIEAEGKLYRQPGAINIEVTTGIDWFDLHGEVQFGDQVVHLPALLQALRKGQNTIVLDDGSVGMLPEEWLKKHGLLIGLGEAEGDKIRFRKHQAGFLDVLLAAQPEARFDLGFRKVREELRNFEGVKPAEPPGSFVGELRGYQKEGLGWLRFLQRFGFGGCLADDMGLGKTVQVLAMLAERKEMKPSPGPALIVVPRSLIFNWKQEAARFAPELRVLDHTGIERLKPGKHFQDYDLILTTYGTLRRDAAEFKDISFDHAILDEAQAIKNAKTESAKAARLLQANHRLALTGTPVENHLGELWSLFEYLNPGMLGHSAVFAVTGRNPDEETRGLLARALRPFLLRRTKAQVAKDLPQKNEQTLYADLEPAQRKLYDELREFYRLSLLNKIAKEGLGKAKIQVLEALLRLRQAACHPGLIDKKRAGEPSAKLDLLLPQLKEVWEEGHKALVFSQFTSFLAILRERLDAEGIAYEYLDGRTRNRAEKVERFQNDPECKLFLISLKAGGVGLNLTAAEYVFLLDPWWNPAVEAQAIDRTHRIGQTRPVFAYRLIARDTVEEKVLKLQETKRGLADAILNQDNSLIRGLSREDLELLLG